MILYVGACLAYCMHIYTYLQLCLHCLVSGHSQLLPSYVEIPSSKEIVAQISMFSSFFIPVCVLLLERGANPVRKIIQVLSST